MTFPLLRLARLLHRVRLFRLVAKKTARNLVVQQPFHGGHICLNAVEHSWAWTSTKKLEWFEAEVQQRLLELMQTRSRLIDIGSNLGVMSLSVLLRTKHASVVAVDPNRQALDLLRTSARQNGVLPRLQTIEAAVTAATEALHYNPTGSFTGHIAASGEVVRSIPLLDLVAAHVTEPSVIKVDIEGYEAALVPALERLPSLPGSALVMELHPEGFNGWGDPRRVLAVLQARGDLTLRSVYDQPLSPLDPTKFHQIEAVWTQ